MKKLLTATLFILSCGIASAQEVDHGRLIVGIDSVITPAVRAGLHNAHYERSSNQLALIAGKPFTSCYYAIYRNDQLVWAGQYTESKAGGYKLIDLGADPKYFHVVLSANPLLAVHKHSTLQQ